MTTGLFGVTRRFGATVALDAVDLVPREGAITGLVGADGAGKTTAIRLLAGLLDADAGRVVVLGRPADDAGVREEVGLMPQRHSLYGDLSIGENLDFFRRLYGLDRKTAAPRIERLLSITRLAPFVDRRADALSGGMYKKLGLACALLHQPRLLLLDEPTNGVDPVSRRELWELLGEFVADGMTVLVATPYMDEAERCHDVVLLHEGRVISRGAPGALIASLDFPVMEVIGADRDAAAALLDAADEVVALSPSGSRLRLVLRPGSVPAVAARVGALGGHLEAVRPTFEDVFLARVAA